MNIDPFLYSSFPANFIFPFLFNFYFIPIFLFNPLQFLRTQCRNSACFSNFFDRFIFGWGKGRWSESWTPIVTPLGFLPRLKKFPRRKRFTSNEWTRSHFHFFYLLLPSDTVTRRALIMRGVKRLSCDTSMLMYPARKPRSESKDEDPRLRSIFRILFIYLILYFFSFSSKCRLARIVGKFLRIWRSRIHDYDSSFDFFSYIFFLFIQVSSSWNGWKILLNSF